MGTYPNVGQAAIDPIEFPNLEAVLDVVYNPFKTEIVLRAEELGIPAYSGFEMLVAQAVFAAEHFLSKPINHAEIGRVHAMLKKDISNVSIVGMPSAGKRSIGLRLAKKLGKRFVDTDALVEQRAAAKKAKDWATADAIRAQLAGMGWAVKDTAQGPQLSKL